MSVVIKRSDKDPHIPLECGYGCCTPIYGKNTRRIRRMIKRGQRQAFRRDLARGDV